MCWPPAPKPRLLPDFRAMRQLTAPARTVLPARAVLP